LNLLDKRPKEVEPGSREWCAEVSEAALLRALELLEGAKLGSMEVVQLMKIRREMVALQREGRPAIWMDPERWKEDPPVAA
jgi:hypothetical protein